MRQNKFIISALAFVALSVSTQANAQWSQTKNVDAFTGLVGTSLSKSDIIWNKWGTAVEARELYFHF